MIHLSIIGLILTLINMMSFFLFTFATTNKTQVTFYTIVKKRLGHQAPIVFDEQNSGSDLPIMKIE